MRSVLHTQVHQLGRHRHVVAQVGHDPERARDYDGDDEYAGQHVVRVVGSGGDVQKEHKVDTHLRDGEHRKAERDAGRPEQRSVGDPEGDGREDYGQLEQARSCTHPRERNGNRCGLHGQLLRALRRLISQNEWLVAAISHDHLSFLTKTPSQFRR